MNILFVILTIYRFIFHYKNPNVPEFNRDEPLILTNYLNNGQVELARRLSRVEPFLGDIESFAGFFRVSDDCIRNMYFWYFPAQNKNKSAPLLVWLQGGPGVSSLYGLFVENGPYYLDSNDELNLRAQSWTQEYSVIYIDNPVGSGFSFSESECYLTTEDQVGMYLSKLMQQFYQLFPNLKANELYLTGESYAGKYIPAMFSAILEYNKDNPTPMNLVGMAIGDGFIDPYSFVDYGTFLNKLGFIFDNQIPQFDQYRDLTYQSLDSGDYLTANKYSDIIFDLIYNLTGIGDFYDYYADQEVPFTNYIEFVGNNSKRLNAGNLTFYDFHDEVYDKLVGDIMQSMGPTVKEIINSGYKTMLYSGHFDLVCPYPMTSLFLRTLEWNGKEEFTKAEQQIWYSKTEPKRVNGFVRSAKNLKQVIIRNSGHMVPMDQPKAGLEMLRNFIYDLEF